MPIAAAVPQRGDLLTIAGYGRGDYKAQTGRCTQYYRPGPGLPFDIVEMSAAARHGDSGGPIFNSRGELAGVLFGEGGGDDLGQRLGPSPLVPRIGGLRKVYPANRRSQIATAPAPASGEAASNARRNLAELPRKFE